MDALVNIILEKVNDNSTPTPLKVDLLVTTFLDVRKRESTYDQGHGNMRNLISTFAKESDLLVEVIERLVASDDQKTFSAFRAFMLASIEYLL